MNSIKLNYRRILEIVLIGIGFYWVLNNFQLLWGWIASLFSVMMPFIMGFIIAFILNVLMIRVERILNLLFKEKKINKLKRTISIGTSLLILIVILACIINLVIPELINAIKLLINTTPDVVENLQDWLVKSNQLPQLEALLENVDLNNITSQITSILKTGLTGVLGSTMGIISTVAGGVINVVVGFVFAIYILISKESLKRQTGKLVQAYLPNSLAIELTKVARLARSTFTNFIIGQSVEAVILGSLCALGMALLRFPYAPMVGALVGITAFIPIVGAFIGGGVGAFVIMTVNPLQAVFFVIYLVILQQLEGNLIYPRVVGSSVGLPSIWVLFAVTVGGGLWGVPGILFSVPLLSVTYALVKEHVNKNI